MGNMATLCRLPTPLRSPPVADDHLVKPFGAGELTARVQAQLRRHSQQTPGGDPTIRFGDIHIDLTHHTESGVGDRLVP